MPHSSTNFVSAWPTFVPCCALGSNGQTQNYWRPTDWRPSFDFRGFSWHCLCTWAAYSCLSMRSPLHAWERRQWSSFTVGLLLLCFLTIRFPADYCANPTHSTHQSDPNHLSSWSVVSSTRPDLDWLYLNFATMALILRQCYDLVTETTDPFHWALYHF